MTILKCNVCGGDIELSADKTFGTCDSCGCTMTFPKVNDEQRADAFNRGNHFRRIGEFDKALTVYERIVQEDPTDAEAHWCCALCRFGIEYVEDPATLEYIPTCHRASFDIFTEDVDYLAAVDHADGVTKCQYIENGEKIAEIQRGILATSQNEKPFDVFVCYKESDENGCRTVDSTIAQDIYYQLTDAGLRVFFARITLEDKVGSEYEPYIFAALNSAKAMIVVGTKPKYLNEVWVKNEWSRYLSIVKHDRSKVLLPCYRDMDPYDMPEQLSVLQSYDMSKIGFIQDLVRGIKKITAVNEQEKSKKADSVNTASAVTNTAPLIRRVFLFLEDGDWQSANEYCEKVLDLEPDNAEAYLGMLMADLKVKTREKLGECPKSFESSKHYQKIIRFGGEDLKAELDGYIKYINERNIRDTYKSALHELNIASSEQEFLSAHDKFISISSYEDANILASKCLYNAALLIYNGASTEAEFNRAHELFVSTNDYSDAKEYAKKCLDIVKEANILANKYNEAMARKDSLRVNKATIEKTKKILEEQKSLYQAIYSIQQKKSDIEVQIDLEKSNLAKNKTEKDNLIQEQEQLGIFAIIRKQQIIEKIDDINFSNKVIKSNIKEMEIVRDGLYIKLNEFPAIKQVEEKILNCQNELTKASNEIESIRTTENSCEKPDDLLAKISERPEFVRICAKKCVLPPKLLIDAGIEDIFLGLYPHDSTSDNNPIEWKVIDKKDGKALIISKYILDYKQYNTTKNDVTWKTCSLRKWLNTDFLNRAFTMEEQKMIVYTGVSADVNPRYDTNPGFTTKDKVFLLSIPEAEKYFDDALRKTICTEYAQVQLQLNDYRKRGFTNREILQRNHVKSQEQLYSILNKPKGDENYLFWLRSPGMRQYASGYVQYDGSIYYYGNVVDGIKGVRPAMWISIDSKRLEQIESSKYDRAMQLIDSGDFDSAYELLEEIGNIEAIESSKYDRAMQLIDSGDFEPAYLLLNGLTYKNSDRKIKEITSIKPNLKCKFADIGDVFTFGKYEQVNKASNEKEDIEWIVLAKENGKALVISKYALDCQKYDSFHYHYEDVTWEKCSLRTWMNETFLNNAFSSAEQAVIATTNVSADINPQYRTDPGNETTDKVFILSVTEAEKYFRIDNYRKCALTVYAEAHGANVSNGIGQRYQTESGEPTCWWWLRSPGHDQKHAACVNVDGSVFYYGEGTSDSRICVRPALWINIE